MTSFRIVSGTLVALATAVSLASLGACSASDRCCGERSDRPQGTVAAAPEPTVAPAAAPIAATAPTAAGPKTPDAHAVDANASPGDAAASAAVHNYRRLSPKFARGASPEGDAAFKALAAAGIRSIVTVDGATPDIEAAKRYGLRYVHIPFGYDGVPEATELELAKTFAQLAPSGPIFIHCHHGKHRGPVACGIGRILVDDISNEEALADLKAAGTDVKYAGLYETIRTFRKPSAEALAAVKADMPEVAPAGSRSAAMSAIDQTWDRMKAVRIAKWHVPAGHADVDPSHEAVILAEGLREFGRRPEIAAESEAFRKMLTDCEAAAWDLSKSIAKDSLDAAKAETSFNATQKLCASCHAQFRDNTHR